VFPALTLNVPPDAVHVTGTWDTGLPNLSTTRTARSKLAPATTALESALARATVVGALAIAVT